MSDEERSMADDEKPEVGERLLTQTEARAEAKALNEAGNVPPGMVAVAHAVPLGSWGGRERGWTVGYAAVQVSGR